MGRKLSTMGWAQVKEELSIAADRDKLIELGKDIQALIVGRMDIKSIPEIESMQLILQKVIAEFKAWEKIQRNIQHPKLK